jgi:tRNA A37 threonylcarbamoyladenosine dehydratase
MFCVDGKGPVSGLQAGSKGETSMNRMIENAKTRMSKAKAKVLVKKYNSERAPDSNVRAIVTFTIEGYEPVLIETETGAIVGTLKK